jgi:hypothetical protein
MLRRVVVLLVFGSLLLAACGGDGGESSEGTTAATGATEGTSEGTTAATGDGGIAGAIDSAQCAEVAAAMAEAAQGSAAAASGSATDLEQSLQQMEAFAEAVPDEIKADVQTVVDGYRAIIEALQSAGYDPTSGEVPPPEAIAALQQVGERLQSEEFQSAVDRVNAYIQSGCQA